MFVFSSLSEGCNMTSNHLAFTCADEFKCRCSVSWGDKQIYAGKITFDKLALRLKAGARKISYVRNAAASENSYPTRNQSLSKPPTANRSSFPLHISSFRDTTIVVLQSGAHQPNGQHPRCRRCFFSLLASRVTSPCDPCRLRIPVRLWVPTCLSTSSFSIPSLVPLITFSCLSHIANGRPGCTLYSSAPRAWPEGEWTMPFLGLGSQSRHWEDDFLWRIGVLLSTSALNISRGSRISEMRVSSRGAAGGVMPSTWLSGVKGLVCMVEFLVIRETVVVLGAWLLFIWSMLSGRLYTTLSCRCDSVIMSIRPSFGVKWPHLFSTSTNWVRTWSYGLNRFL